jgi:dUTP pyrophosphatase
MDIYFKSTEPNAIIPTLGTIYSAGYDFYSCENKTIPAFGRQTFKTGISVMWTDPSVYLQLQSRSGLALKHGITCEAGVIDYDYLKEIIVILQNHTPEEYTVAENDRICQGVFLIKPMILNTRVVNNWEDIHNAVYHLPYLHSMTNIRSGGFGSTGR